MERLGVISRVEEPTDWCCGMVVAPKKDKEKVRICVDMTPLNESVCRERYILPSVEQTLGMLTGAQYFSKLDANMGFWQIPLSKESAPLTTFITPFGRYHFNRLPFDISSAPEHFQNMMVTEVTAGLEGVVCHMDDILVWGSTMEQHDKRLHAVLERAEKAGVTLNMSKCEFGKRKVKFLGFIVSAVGMSPDPEKTQAVQDMKEPSNVSELRSFLGMVNQLGKFIPNLSEKDKPLRDLLSAKNMWYWGQDQQKAFHNLKQELSSAPVLQLYDPNKPQKISADASSYGLGAVMLQREGDVWSPVAYASRSLTPTEQRYAQLEKEALALTWACERFNDFILGLHFELETDHKPLVSLLGGQALDALPPRIQRFRMRLMRYAYTIKHIPGKSLTTADTLSRLPLTNSVIHTDTDLMENTNIYVESVLEGLPASSKYLADLQGQLRSDSVCSQVMKHCVEGWLDCNHLQGAVKHYWPERAVLSVHNGLLLRGTRLVIHAIMRNGVLDKIHEGHQGVVKCRERARQAVWWPGLSNQISELVLKCRQCIQERVNVREPLMPTDLPERPWQKLGADLFTLKDKSYLLLIDYFSRYVKIAQLSPTRSVTVIVHLKSMFARHGIPETLITDNGPQFSCREMEHFAKEYCFEHITSSSRYPQSNGEAERDVRTVKDLLKKASDPYRALLADRTTALANGYSPAQLLMGRRLRTTLPMLPEALQPCVPDLRQVRHVERERRLRQTERFNARHRTRDLDKLLPGHSVWITDAKAQGTVTSVHQTPRSYVISGPHGTIRSNRSHLMPIPMSETQTEQQLTQSNEKSIPREAVSEPKAQQGVVRTRSGREVKKPERLNL
uniref:Gypsy retrotransposon integrase-like protein 1 n=1 Tax=Gouania willdenowi TaxID=441366 RepID=A0A8C5D510_GOUWI